MPFANVTHENYMAESVQKCCSVFTQKLNTSKQQRLTKKPEKSKFNSAA